MNQPDDIELLRQFADHDSEAAFATLVARHVNRHRPVTIGPAK